MSRARKRTFSHMHSYIIFILRNMVHYKQNPYAFIHIKTLFSVPDYASPYKHKLLGLLKHKLERSTTGSKISNPFIFINAYVITRLFRASSTTIRGTMLKHVAMDLGTCRLRIIHNLET